MIAVVPESIPVPPGTIPVGHPDHKPGVARVVSVAPHLWALAEAARWALDALYLACLTATRTDPAARSAVVRSWRAGRAAVETTLLAVSL